MSVPRRKENGTAPKRVACQSPADRTAEAINLKTGKEGILPMAGEIFMRIDMMRHIITILTTILRMYLISSGSMNSKMATASGDSSRTHPITGRIRITSYQKKLRPLLHPLVNEVRRAKGHLQPVGLRFQRILSRRLRNWLRTMTRRVSQNI